jgi:probable rRNA maturation factor
MAVQFFFLSNNITLKERTRLKNFIPQIFKKHRVAFESLNYIFCSDEYLLQINKEHLQHNFYTDIITFHLSTKGSPLIGEIYISTERVRDNANTLGTSLKEELHRVIFHGALHLCGYKDKQPKEIKQMRQAENNCLEMYFK